MVPALFSFNLRKSFGLVIPIRSGEGLRGRPNRTEGGGEPKTQPEPAKGPGADGGRCPGRTGNRLGRSAGKRRPGVFTVPAKNRLTRARGIVGAMGLFLATFALMPAATWGQEGSPRPPRVRTLLKTAIDLNKRGDYENAARYYSQVQAGQEELTPTEKRDLLALIQQNNVALQGQLDGTTQLRKAEEAFRLGKLDEASRLLKGVTANQYLSAGDRQSLNQLNDLFRTAEKKDSGAGADVKALMAQARDALKRGEIDTAETLAKQAEKANSGLMSWVHSPWADTPAKVVRDVQAARTKAMAEISPAPKEEKTESSGPFKTVWSYFRTDEKKPMAPPEPSPTINAKTSDDKQESGAVAGVRSWFPWNRSASSSPAPKETTRPFEEKPKVATEAPRENPVTQVSVPALPERVPGQDGTAQARQYLTIGYKALQENDLEKARRYAYAAKELRPNLAYWEPNPDRLLAEIQRKNPTEILNASTKPEAIATPAPAPAVETKMTDMETDPRILMREARSRFQANQLDEAEKLCTRAALSPARWGLFEDNPDKLRNEIQKTRRAKDREEATRLLSEGRQLLSQGKLAEAKQAAWKAEKLHGPYSYWDMGDRPQRLLTDIDKAEKTQGKASPLPPPPANNTGEPQSRLTKPNQDLRKGPMVSLPPRTGSEAVATAPPAPTVPGSARPVPGPAPVTPPGTVQAPDPATILAKQRAVALLAEAMELQRNNKLVEARQKALDARQLPVTFQPDENSPDLVLMSLAALCDRKVQNLMQQATETVTAGGDLPRIQKAEQDLQEAKNLAQAFGQDLSRIDQKMNWVQEARVAAGMPGTAQARGPELPLPPPQVVQNPSTIPGETDVERQRRVGLEKLDKARLELRAGNTAIARPLAEDVFRQFPDLRDEASSVIRSLDAEDHNQMLLAARRTADAGIDAFLRRDYRQAAGILASVDPKALTPEMQVRVREILATQEMQPQPLALAKVPVQGTKPGTAGEAGTAKVGDLQPASLKEDGLLNQYKALEEVQFQQLRDRGLAAQGRAIEHFRSGDAAAAIDLLKEYLDQLQGAQLDAEKVALLRRPVENRMQQYRTLMAQRTIEAEQKNLLNKGQHNEGKRNAAIQKTQDEVVELFKEFRTYQKEGKYKEARMVALKIKDLDPDNVAADAALGIATVAERQKIADDIRATNERRVNDAIQMDMGPSVNFNDPLLLDGKALERSKKRGDTTNGIWTQNKNAMERSIERKLTAPISLNFQDVSLGDCIRDLQAQSNLNIVPDNVALADASISLDQKLTLSVENISLKSALNILLAKVRLTYVIKDEVLMITTSERASGKLKQVTYPVADLVVPVDNHQTPTINSLQDAIGRHIAGQSGVIPPQSSNPATPPLGMSLGQTVSQNNPYTPGGSGGMPGMGGTNVTKQSASHTMEDLLINLVTNSVSPNTWTNVGGPGTIQYFPLGMALVINQTQEVQEEVAALLQALRRLQDLEVAIEMRLVSVSEAFFERIGLDFDVNLITPNSRFQSQLLSQQFQPFGNVNRIEFDSFVSGLTPAGTLTPDLSIPIRASSFDFSAPPFGGFPGTLGADGGLSLGLAFLSDIQVFMFLEAAQGDRRTNVMQAPKITVFNGQTAFISVNDLQFFLLGVTLNQSAFGQLFFQPQNQPVPLGVNLQVTPVVSADRRFVRLNLTPSLTNLASATVPLIPVQITVPSIFFGPGVGTTSGQPENIFQMFFQQPTFTQINLSTTVNVPDGGTVLLGGLKTLSEARNEFGPPILSKIPYISRLFRNVGYGREAQSLMIMVTPRIIINEEEEQIFLGQVPPIPRP